MDNITGAGVIDALLLVICSGALGGLVKLISPITNSRKNSLKYYVFNVCLHSVLGATTALSIFFLAPILNIEWAAIYTKPAEFLRIFSMCILSGYSGTALLSILADKLELQIAKSEFQRVRQGLSSVQLDVERIEKALNHVIEARILSSEGEEELALNPPDKKKALKYFRRSLKEYDKALKFIELANIYAGRSFVLKRLYLHSEIGELQRINFLKKAFNDSTRALKLDPEYATAFYNRACYRRRFQTHFPNNEKYNDVRIKSDLTKAFKLNPDLKKDLKTDEDLKDKFKASDF